MIMQTGGESRKISTTYLILGFNVLVYALMLTASGGAEFSSFSGETLVEGGALYAPLVREGQVWRMLTAMFIHITPIHIFMNMIALFQVGNWLEPYYGRVRYVMIYLIAGLGGSALSLIYHWDNPVVSAGASGAISGLIGAGALAGHLAGNEAGRRIRNAMLQWTVLTFVLGAYIGADNAAHFGGLVGGVVAAWLFERQGIPSLWNRPTDRGPGLESALLLLLVAGGFSLAAVSRDDARTAGTLIRQGFALNKEGDSEAAAEVLRRAVRLEPRNPEAHYYLSVALYSQGEYIEAAERAEIVTKLAPDNAQGYELLADTLDALGRNQEAEEARRRAVELTATTRD